MLDDDIDDRLREILGFADDGELKNARRPRAQRGLWFVVSGFASARIYGPLVAMQIKADPDGTWSAPCRLLDRHAGLSPAE